MSIGFSSDLQEEVRLDDDGGDNFDGHAHYAPKEGLVEAMIYGTPVIALCGLRFIPRRDPERFPVCPKCKALHEVLPTGGGE